MLLLGCALALSTAQVTLDPLRGGVFDPRGGELVDFDGDGVADLIVLDHHDGRATISRGRGDGTFELAEVVADFVPNNATFASPYFAVGDLNGDGQLDLAAAGGGYSEVVAVGLIDPQSGEATVRSYHVQGGPPLGIAMADVTRDGRPDLLVWSSLGRTQYLEQLPTGDFAVARNLFDPARATTNALVVADLDSDGQDDLVFSDLSLDGGPTALSVVAVTQGAPFSATQVSILGAAAGYVTTGDLDADGDPEIVATGVGDDYRPFVLTNLGGHFGVPTLIVPGAFPAGGASVIDVEGDGDLDVYASNGMYINDGNGTFSQPSGRSDPNLYAISALGDVDGDRVIDTIHIRSSHSSTTGGFVNVLRGKLMGSVYRYEQAAELSERIGALPLHLFDANGDPLPDLLVAERHPTTRAVEVSWKRGRSGGEFARIVPLFSDAPSGRPNYAAGDVDGDGDEDVLVSAEGSPDVLLLENDGTGQFAAPRVALTVSAPRFRHFELEDLDGDGRDDLMFTGAGGGQLRYALGQTDGSFSAPTLFLTAPLSNVQTQVLDWDGDGRRDVLVFSGSHLLLMRNLGAHGFDWAHILADEVNGDDELPSRFLADVDGDGRLDIVALREREIRAWRGQAGSTFGALQVVSPPGVNVNHFALIDFDLDGDLDLVGGAWDPTMATHRLATSEQTSPFAFSSWAFRTERPSNITLRAIYDFDGDGDEDALFGELRGTALIVSPDVLSEIGSDYCGPAVPNSTGEGGTLRALGSTDLVLGELRLVAGALPSGSIGYFLASQTQQINGNVPNSVGRLCLGGEIGRFVGPGQIGNVDAAGELRLQVDMSAIPSPMLGSVPVLAGQTWSFQAWHRDMVGGASTSNFTEGRAVSF